MMEPMGSPLRFLPDPRNRPRPRTKFTMRTEVRRQSITIPGDALPMISASSGLSHYADIFKQIAEQTKARTRRRRMRRLTTEIPDFDIKENTASSLSSSSSEEQQQDPLVDEPEEEDEVPVAREASAFHETIHMTTPPPDLKAMDDLNSQEMQSDADQEDSDEEEEKEQEKSMQKENAMNASLNTSQRRSPRLQASKANATPPASATKIVAEATRHDLQDMQLTGVSGSDEDEEEEENEIEDQEMETDQQEEEDGDESDEEVEEEVSASQGSDEEKDITNIDLNAIPSSEEDDENEEESAEEEIEDPQKPVEGNAVNEKENEVVREQEVVAQEDRENEGVRQEVEVQNQELSLKKKKRVTKKKPTDTQHVQETSHLATNAASSSTIMSSTSNNMNESRRYPLRNRVAPTQYWRGERIKYARDSTGLAFKVAGMIPGKEEVVKERKRSQKRKRTNSSAELHHPNPFDLSLHASNVSGLLAQDRKRKKKILKQNHTVASLEDLNWVPSKNVGVDMAIIKREVGMAHGMIRMAPFSCKQRQKTVEYSTTFVIVFGACQFTVGDMEPILLKTGNFVELKPHTYYSIDNLRNDRAIIKFDVLRTTASSPSKTSSKSSKHNKTSSSTKSSREVKEKISRTEKKMDSKTSMSVSKKIKH